MCEVNECRQMQGNKWTDINRRGNYVQTIALLQTFMEIFDEQINKQRQNG